MATRTYTQKDGTVWEWEETPELSKWIVDYLTSKAQTDSSDDLSRT